MFTLQVGRSNGRTRYWIQLVEPYKKYVRSTQVVIIKTKSLTFDRSDIQFPDAPSFGFLGTTTGDTISATLSRPPKMSRK